MSALISLFAILGALLIGAISPGPSFILVSRLSAARSRLHGFAAALGMGVGSAIFAGLALFGLTALLDQVAWLSLALRLAGGLYLGWLGLRIWRGADTPLVVAGGDPLAARSPTRSFWLALITQLSNPKTAIVYASIFAAMLPASPPLWLMLLLPPLGFAVDAGWYAIVALAFSAERPRGVYLRSKGMVDRVAGAVMGLLGARLVSEAFASSKL